MKENKDVLAYIKKKGWKYNDKRDINNYYIEKCPFCGDSKFHFHINRITGQYNCWKCPDDGEQTGNLWKLKKSLGDIIDVAKLDPVKPKKTKAEIEDLSLRVRAYHKKLCGHKRAQRIINEKYGFMME